METIDSIELETQSLNAGEALAYFSSRFNKIKFATSLGEEDQIITHLIASAKLPIEVFTLDTGRLFQETYELLELTQHSLGVNIKAYFPYSEDVERYVNDRGINAFYYSVADRKECCHIRKVVPLQRALAGAQLWITGLRSAQSTNRQSMKKIEWNEELQLIKYNPLFDWTDEDVSQYILQNKVPVNPLHKKGFVSIGCAPCTRAITAGEDPRAGRWWWEGTAKECGLHVVKN